MENFDRHDEQAFRHLDDLQLEVVRAEMIADGDERLGIVIRALVLRAVPVIEKVCRTRGTARGLSREQILKSIDDASVRLLLRLQRPDRQPAVPAVAADIAAACVDVREPQPPAAPRLAARRPELHLAEGLGEALKEGRLRPNNWRSS